MKKPEAEDTITFQNYKDLLQPIVPYYNSTATAQLQMSMSTQSNNLQFPEGNLKMYMSRTIEQNP